jgi:hypothetical protein
MYVIFDKEKDNINVFHFEALSHTGFPIGGGGGVDGG